MLGLDDLEVALDTDAGLLKAVDGLSLAIERGETFALVGESGCGKSMTALALMRLLPDSGRVVGGRLTLDGQDLFDWPEAAMRRVRGRRIGMIFQEPATSLNPVMTLGQQIVEVIESHTALRGRAARERAIEWLQRVGIPQPQRRIDDYPFRLSGGQKQRAMIALALAGEPDFLLADEPTTALDVTIQAQILDLLRSLQRERGMGMLLITHDLAVVSGMADRVALMYAGQIVEVAPAREFFSQPRHPYARALLRALPEGRRRGGGLAAIPGSVPALTQTFAGCRYAPRCELAFADCGRIAPPLDTVGAAASVRCLLYTGADDGPSARPATQKGRTDTARPGAGEPRFDPTAPKTADAASPLLELRRVSVRFPIRGGLLQRVRGAYTAVNDVSLTLPAGRTLALVGESGCGKTTLGKAIVQLLRGQAEVEGQALLQGQDLFRLQGEALRDARRAAQMIFQDPFASLDPRMRIADTLEEGMQALRPQWDARQRRAHVLALLEQVGLPADTLGRFPHEFSGGQRQRIAIARALAVQPRLIVCDEPTSALDVSVQAQILNLLARLQRELDVAYLFITHNIGVVEYLADDLAVMRNGRIEEQGPAAQVLDRPASPYTRSLLAAVPRMRAR